MLLKSSHGGWCPLPKRMIYYFQHPDSRERKKGTQLDVLTTPPVTQQVLPPACVCIHTTPGSVIIY